ncbi:MAG: beta-ketoacyl-[acyl-carrier-protein] synthase family protein [Nitrospirota bacterium]
MRKIVVTGIGAISPVGNSFCESWEAAKAGLSGIRLITRFDASMLPWKVAGELKRFNAEAYLSQKEINRLDPFVHYAVAAAMMAVEDAGLLQVQSSKFKVQSYKEENSELKTQNSELLSSCGVIIGSSRGGITTIEKSIVNSYKSSVKTNDQCPMSNDKSFNSSFVTRHSSLISPYLMPATTISMASSYVAQKLGIKGYCLGISNACASGTVAIGEAYRLIKSGYSGPVLCGGTEAPVCRLCVEGYGVSGALSKINDPTASRPFDRTRNGFVLAEGACILVLEDYEAALKRDARIYGEIIGYGNATDAFHQTRPDPEGEARAIKMAMDEAGIEAQSSKLKAQGFYINAHGTSTPLGDKAETEAIKLVFGKDASNIPVSSVKSMTGHMLAASGALEAAFTLMSMNEGIIAPTINLKEKGPECDLDIVTGIRKSEINVAISNSFGFGGVNAVLAFGRVR